MIVLVVVLIGCRPGGLTALNGAALGASTAALLCDWGQTRSLASDGWGRTRETNPLMGERPTTTVVDTYFAVTILINATIWRTVPKRYRWIAPSAVAASQARSISRNMDDLSNPGFCGLHR